MAIDSQASKRDSQFSHAGLAEGKSTSYRLTTRRLLTFSSEQAAVSMPSLSDWASGLSARRRFTSGPCYRARETQLKGRFTS